MRNRIIQRMLAVSACLVGCAGEEPSPPADVGAATAVPGQDAGTVPTSPAAPFREYLSAREAFEIAESAATSLLVQYALFEVMGCHKVADPGRFEKATSLVSGQCATWLFRYYAPRSDQGFDQLLVWVGPNGVLDTRETPQPSLVGKKPHGHPSDWLIDSPEALEIAEREGGQAQRESDPEWDPGLFDSNRNALLMAKLTFYPCYDFRADGLGEIKGSKGCVWEIKYPPLGDLVFVIDAHTGEVLAIID